MADNRSPPRRWFHLTPDRFVLGLLIAVCLLWLSERFQWFAFNHHKGWTVLLAVGAVGIAVAAAAIWYAGGLLGRPHVQFGIRSLLVIVTVLSITFGWLALEMRRARQQADAIAWIESLSGHVISDGPYSARGKQEPLGVPLWRALVGEQFFTTLTGIQFFGESRITDRDLWRLDNLTQLISLDVHDAAITDARTRTLRRHDQATVAVPRRYEGH